MKLDSETGGIVGHLDASPVQIGHSRDEAEDKAVAGAVAADLEAVKPPQDVLAFIDRNSRPAIGHRNNGLARGARNCDCDQAFGTAEFYGIVDKV